MFDIDGRIPSRCERHADCLAACWTGYPSRSGFGSTRKFAGLMMADSSDIIGSR
jgi:hypothetical protein